MNPNDIFWLASYAHRVLTPLMGPLDANLKLNLNFGGPYPGLDIWTHHNSDAAQSMHRCSYKLVAKNKQDVDKFAATLQPLEVGIAV